jgi:hypothetical protein
VSGQCGMRTALRTVYRTREGRQGSTASQLQVCVALVSPVAKPDTTPHDRSSLGGADSLVRLERVDININAPRCRCCISKNDQYWLADGVAFRACPARYLSYWTATAEWRDAALDADLTDGSSLPCTMVQRP